VSLVTGTVASVDVVDSSVVVDSPVVVDSSVVDEDCVVVALVVVFVPVVFVPVVFVVVGGEELTLVLVVVAGLEEVDEEGLVVREVLVLVVGETLVVVGEDESVASVVDVDGVVEDVVVVVSGGVVPVDVAEVVGLVVSVVGVLVEVSGVVVVVVLVSVGSVVVELGGVSQSGVVKVLSSRLTCPLRASARPMTSVPVVTEMEVSAMIVPTKSELVPSVAELPTCQKTWQAWAPLTMSTSLAEAVIRVEAIWKMKTEFGLPWPSRVSVPPRASGPVEL
jgi:hypothetical protein